MPVLSGKSGSMEANSAEFCVEVVDCTMMNLSWAAAGAVAPAKASPAVVAAASARKERLSMAISLFGDGSQQQPAFQRSEEHTSELQSLMRISYAVFCLTKKNKNHIN